MRTNDVAKFSWIRFFNQRAADSDIGRKIQSVCLKKKYIGYQENQD